MPHKNTSVAIIQVIYQALNAPQGHKRKNVINPDLAHKPFFEFYCKSFLFCFTISDLMIRKGPISEMWRNRFYFLQFYPDQVILSSDVQ